MSVEIIKFGNVPKAIQEGSDLAILSLVTRVTSLAKALAPVDFGQLRNSIMGRVEKKDIGFNQGGKTPAPSEINEIAREGEGYVGSNLLHSIYNEFGTRKMAAQPFLRPAIETEASGAKAKASIIKFQNKSVKEGMRKGPRIKKVVK